MGKLTVRGVQWPFGVHTIAVTRLATLFPVGRRVRGRIVAKLEQEKYLLRLRGHHFVAHSSVQLDEGAVFTAVVRSTSPRLYLQLEAEKKLEHGGEERTSLRAGNSGEIFDEMREWLNKLLAQVDIRI